MGKFKPLTYIKNRIKGIVFGRTRLGDFVNSSYDLYLFLRFSFSINKLKSQNNYKAYLTKQYHIIEKGLSLPFPRQNFGKTKIEELLKKSKTYIKRYGEDELTFIIKNCLHEYCKINPKLNEVYPVLFNNLNEFINSQQQTELGGTKLIDKKYINKVTNIDYKEFVRTRVSVRNFDNKSINFQDVYEAVDIARCAPSVCNRQGWNLHYFDDRKLMDKLLFLQAGNTGFTESIKALLIVTTDIEQFTKLEKNQIYVDGGLFSMNLLLALHYKGVGSCCLNTCVPYTTEIKIKKLADINTSERLIMMIGIGYLKDEFKTAYSYKKEVNQILKKH